MNKGLPVCFVLLTLLFAGCIGQPETAAPTITPRVPSPSPTGIVHIGASPSPSPTPLYEDIVQELDFLNGSITRLKDEIASNAANWSNYSAEEKNTTLASICFHVNSLKLMVELTVTDLRAAGMADDADSLEANYSVIWNACHPAATAAAYRTIYFADETATTSSADKTFAELEKGATGMGTAVKKTSLGMIKAGYKVPSKSKTVPPAKKPGGDKGSGGNDQMPSGMDNGGTLGSNDCTQIENALLERLSKLEAASGNCGGQPLNSGYTNTGSQSGSSQMNPSQTGTGSSSGSTPSGSQPSSNPMNPGQGQTGAGSSQGYNPTTPSSGSTGTSVLPTSAPTGTGIPQLGMYGEQRISDKQNEITVDFEINTQQYLFGNLQVKSITKQEYEHIIDPLPMRLLQRELSLLEASCMQNMQRGDTGTQPGSGLTNTGSQPSSNPTNPSQSQPTGAGTPPGSTAPGTGLTNTGFQPAGSFAMSSVGSVIVQTESRLDDTDKNKLLFEAAKISKKDYDEKTDSVTVKVSPIKKKDITDEHNTIYLLFDYSLASPGEPARACRKVTSVSVQYVNGEIVSKNVQDLAIAGDTVYYTVSNNGKYSLYSAEYAAESGAFSTKKIKDYGACVGPYTSVTNATPACHKTRTFKSSGYYVERNAKEKKSNIVKGPQPNSNAANSRQTIMSVPIEYYFPHELACTLSFCYAMEGSGYDSGAYYLIARNIPKK